MSDKAKKIVKKDVVLDKTESIVPVPVPVKTHILSRSMRPTSFDDIIGQDANIKYIKSQLNSARIPHFYIISGLPGTGKCLGYNTPVIMYDGSIKNVQDIKESDQLMGDDSTPRNVLNVCKGQEPMYRIKQSKGTEYIVNETGES